MTKLFVCFWIGLTFLFSVPVRAGEDSTQGKTWKTINETYQEHFGKQHNFIRKLCC